MAAAHTALEVYVAALKNAHAMCAEARTVYARQADHAGDYPQIGQRLDQQARVVAQHMHSIEQALAALDETPSKLKDMVTSTIGAVAELGHAVTGDTVMKDYFVAASFAGLSHVAFRSLKTSAELAGQARNAEAIDRAIEDTETFGRWIYEKVDQLTRDYTARVGRGDEAAPT